MQRRSFWMLVGLLATAAASAGDPPAALLQRISDAMQSLTYQGTLIHTVDGETDILHVAHRNEGGVSMEKLVTMDGEARESLRVGNELVCLFPERKIKFIDSSAGPSNAFVRLPAVARQLERYYTLEPMGTQRIAGREALRYRIAPRDGFRYGHRLWVDSQSLLPLKMQLVANDRVLEEVRFTDVTIGRPIDDAVFVMSIDDSDFRVLHAQAPEIEETDQLRPAGRMADAEAAQESQAQDDTSGFRLRASEGQLVNINGRVARRYEFSDGLASVSVFVSSSPRTRGVAQHQRFGSAHSYQQQVGDSTMTLVGEVPLQTLRMLAERTERELEDLDARTAVATDSQ